MAKFHIVVAFKSVRVGNQICTIHRFSRGSDSAKYLAIGGGDFSTLSRVSLPEFIVISGEPERKEGGNPPSQSFFKNNLTNYF
jgi:hypothetical protein